MRLIDADKITSGEIAKYLGRGYECCISDIEDMLKEQPTAYDVDKVVKQLDEKSFLLLQVRSFTTIRRTGKM